MKVYDNAISDYNNAIRFEPNYGPVYYNCGIAYLRSGHRTKANADVATAKRLNGDR